MELNLAVVAINAWNRMAVAFRQVPGTYQVGAHQVKAVSHVTAPTG